MATEYKRMQQLGGAYKDFDPTKMLAREIQVITSGDPASDTGRSIYVCFAPGVVKRIVSYEDFETEMQNAFEEIQAAFMEEIQAAIAAANTAAEAANSAKVAADSAAGFLCVLTCVGRGIGRIRPDRETGASESASARSAALPFRYLALQPERARDCHETLGGGGGGCPARRLLLPEELC